MGGKQRDEDDEAYGKPVKYDPSFRGPIKNRSCTDVICCVLFLLFILGYIVVGIVAWLYGDPRQVLYPRNSTGAYCGMGENKDKPYLLYFNIFSCILSSNIISVAENGLQCPTPQTVITSLQQELCPSFLLPSAPALGRCFPWTNVTPPALPGITNDTTIQQGISGLIDSLNARDISVKIFEDFAQSWYWILVALGVALVLSLLFILLLRLVAGPLVLVLILGVLGVLAYGIYYCWEEYRVLRDKGASISQLGFTTNLSAYQSVQETWLAALIVLAVLEAILLLMLIFLRQRIRIAIALLKEASKAVGQMMSTMFYPLVTFVLLLICIAYWAMTALYLATSGQPQYVLWASNISSPGCEKVPINTSCNPTAHLVNSSCPGLMCVFQGYSSKGLIQRSVFNLQIYGVLGLFWTLNWVLALGQCVLAGAFASFYWAFHKPQDIPTFPLISAFIRTLRYHTGSLAFGALILTLVQIARVILEYIDHKLRGVQNPVARCIMCCFKCCLWCLEKFIKFLNRNAYIMIAIYGKNFCVSAKNAFMLLMRNIVRVVVLDKVTDLLLFFGKLLVVGGVGVLSFFFFSGRIPGLGKDFKSPHLNYYWLPIMTSILGAYVIASGFFSVFGMCVDTLFLCFLEDLERNNGSLDRPYYMSKSLLKILGKKNEAPPDNKKRKK
ncbi:choline transporter-like protein 4 isoform 2 [Homo sapiens]|uniref:Isoform 4 of Choline transporter-like protein 4 n=1 Tax=Homo sapiens TaxID=9606 RepID=Q53GD3-4|nr:choline transporter-like protein 4 isoform 2 [Homo sapiens]KAI2541699.1 solute carrier family 44 member 4 [Homo sapiens]|eukprot:NP_001171515.1 choline transporter-like protein 4 isoform 2 [Homo sapiens]